MLQAVIYLQHRHFCRCCSTKSAKVMLSTTLLTASFISRHTSMVTHSSARVQASLVSSTQATGARLPSSSRSISPTVYSLRLFGKHIAALGTAGAFDKSGAAQLGNDLFQIFVGNILPLGDIFNGDEAAGMIVSQVKHQPQSITSFGRDFHKHTSFQKLDIILLLVY